MLRDWRSGRRVPNLHQYKNSASQYSTLPPLFLIFFPVNEFNFLNKAIAINNLLLYLLRYAPALLLTAAHVYGACLVVEAVCVGN
jgi:hypothetical protein